MTRKVVLRACRRRIPNRSRVVITQFRASVRKGYQRSCILLTVTPLHSRDRSRRESNNGIHAR